MKFLAGLLLSSCYVSAIAYGGPDIYESCKTYEMQRSPGHEPTPVEALEVGLCLGISMATYEMLHLNDNKSTGICLPDVDLTPKDVATLFTRQMVGKDLTGLTATQAILGALLAEYPCNASK